MDKLIKYYSVYCCVECKSDVGLNKMMYSGGTCPNCGNTSGSTVVECFKRIAVKTQINPKWKFWAKTYLHQWRDDYLKSNDNQV